MADITHESLLRQADGWLKNTAEMLAALPDRPLDTFDPRSTALCVLDMVNGFAVSGALASPRVGALIEPIATLARRCRGFGMPVIAFADTHTTESPELTNYPPHCLRGTAEAELCEAIAAVPGIVRIEKNSTNGFLERAFADWLQKEAATVDNFLVVGDCTDICVYQFAVAIKAHFNANDRTCRVIVPTDLTETFDGPAHPAELLNAVFWRSMQENGVELCRRIL